MTMDTYRLVRACMEDAGEMANLVACVYQQLPDRSIFSAANINESYITEEFLRGGYGVLARTEDGRLAGILLACVPDGEDNLGRDAGLPEAELPYVLHMDASAVLPEHRGHHLEKRMLKAAEEMADEKYRWFLCTVSPINPASLITVQKSGYRIMATKEKYQGKLRHILMKRRGDAEQGGVSREQE